MRYATFFLRSQLSARRGFSLLELVIATGILVLLTGMVVSVQRSLAMAQRQQDLHLQAQRSARQAIDAISDELRFASPIALNPTTLELAPIDLGTINQAFLQFKTVTWDAATSARVTSNWTQYQLDAGGTTVSRVQYNEGGGPIIPAVLTVATTRQVANNIYTEPDLNGNGVMDGAEDANGDGRWQRGLFFMVTQEDVNDDDVMGPAEDDDGDGAIDARVIMTVDTRVVGAPPNGGTGYATIATVVELRNANVPGV